MLYTVANMPYQIFDVKTEHWSNLTGNADLDFTESQSPVLEDYSQCRAGWMHDAAQMPSEKPSGTGLMSDQHASSRP